MLYVAHTISPTDLRVWKPGWDKLQHYIYKPKQGDIFVIFIQRKAALFERDDVFSGTLF